MKKFIKKTIKTIAFLLLLFVSIFTESTYSQVNENWVARYTTNTGVTGADYDRAYSVDIDEQGYVYVTGASYETVANGTDITTIKYALNGTQEWLRSYNGPQNNFDGGIVVKTDAQGNVYVAGNAASDIVTIKYNSSGQQQWLSRYNGTGNFDDYPNAMVMDASGNIYIAGEVRETGGQKKDYITIKYNSAGVQQWAKEYGTPSQDDMAHGIGVDLSGNVYVTGQGA